VERSNGLHRPLALAAIYSGFQGLVGARRARRWLAAQSLRLAPGARIVDVGCGTADVLEFVPAGVAYAGFDPNRLYVERAERRYGARPDTVFLHGTSTVASDDDRFRNADVVLCVGVLHHLDDRQADGLLSFCRHALAPAGRFQGLEPAWLPTQSRLSRFVMSLDRGLAIRDLDGWRRLVANAFAVSQVTPVTHLIRIPYTYAFLDGSESCDQRPALLASPTP
jgi:SAM-dependent methyltransferase